MAVRGWSPVTMMTLMPASRHLATAAGTVGRGGSMSDTRPRNVNPSIGKLYSNGSVAAEVLVITEHGSLVSPTPVLLERVGGTELARVENQLSEAEDALPEAPE